MRILPTAIFTVAAFAASFTAASAQQYVQAGVLDCQGGRNVAFFIGSSTNLECVYRGSGRRPEPYLATINRIGVDIGVTDATRLSWVVNAPSYRIARGALAGNYGGVGGNAAIGVGGGGNLLVGGAYALQPLSVQGQTGLNVSGGIVGLQLQPAYVVQRRSTNRRRR